MKRSLVPLLALSLIGLVACNQAANNNASSSSSASGSAAASARATGSVAASAPASASASASTKYITLEVPAPQSGMNAGVDGKGWMVDVVAKGNGPAMEKVKPSFQTTAANATGRNTSFPGLVVLIKSSSGSSSSGTSPNLAKLFQMIGLANTLQGAGISSVGTSASGSPAASASARPSASGSTAPSAAGSAATSSKAVDQETAEATWFVQQSMWGSDADVELNVFVVDGDAPDSVSNDTSNLKIVSNIVTVHFHINGGSTGNTPSGSASPSASTAPSSAPSGSASPSPSSTP